MHEKRYHPREVNRNARARARCFSRFFSLLSFFVKTSDLEIRGQRHQSGALVDAGDAMYRDGVEVAAISAIMRVGESGNQRTMENV